MTYRELITEGRQRLRMAHIDAPLTETELLLAHAVKKPKASIIAHPEARAVPAQKKTFLDLIERRARHEPVAYLLGYKDFYGRPFLVNEAVLIPRPETETLVEEALHEITRTGVAGKETVIFDIGTGSGVIGLSIAAARDGARAVLADSSSEALEVAGRNAKHLGLSERTVLLELDIMDTEAAEPELPDGFLVLTANLPYLPDFTWRSGPKHIKDYEPASALISGADGLDHYRALMRRLRDWRLTPDLMLLEVDPHQCFPLSKIVHAALPGHRLSVRKDLKGQDRVLVAQAPREH